MAYQAPKDYEIISLFFTYSHIFSDVFYLNSVFPMRNRNVVYHGETINILDVANKYKYKYKCKCKCKFNLPFTDKYGRRLYCKVSIIPIELPKYPDKQFNLVVVYGFGTTPMMLLSNLKSENSRLAVAITKVYLMR